MDSPSHNEFFPFFSCVKCLSFFYNVTCPRCAPPWPNSGWDRLSLWPWKWFSGLRKCLDGKRRGEFEMQSFKCFHVEVYFVNDIVIFSCSIVSFEWTCLSSMWGLVAVFMALWIGSVIPSPDVWNDSSLFSIFAMFNFFYSLVFVPGCWSVQCFDNCQFEGDGVFWRPQQVLVCMIVWIS